MIIYKGNSKSLDCKGEQLMGQFGLLLLGIIQLGTGISMFFSVGKKHIFGIATLPKQYSTYRYMLTSLWISVSFMYFIGAINPVFTMGASLLAIINVLLEIGGYWLSKLPRWYQISGTIVMALAGFMSGSAFF